MPVLLLLAMLAAATDVEAPHGAIEATIRGTAQPLDVDLLLRDANDEWSKVDHRRLPAGMRNVRFDGLEPGVYQILLRGPQSTEQLGTQVAVGRGDRRRKTIDVEPFIITGRVTLGGTHLGAGVVLLKHRELHWRAGIGLDAKGAFRVPMWQRAKFSASVRSPALPTEYLQTLEIDGGTSPIRLTIDIPDGQITGIVRDATSGAPVADVTVALQTNTADREEHVKLTTNAEGRFAFAGIKHGRHIVRLYPPQHLEPEPVAFTLDPQNRLRELDVRLDRGRDVSIVVIDGENDPVSNAKVFAVADSRLCARTTTDEDGRATIAAPGERTTLFVVAPDAPFGMLRIPRETPKERLRIHLARPTSSLLIRALRTDGKAMPPFSLLMRFNGEIVPPGVADELAAAQGLLLATGPDSEAHLRNIPTGSYEFWPYRSEGEMQSIVAGGAFLAPIQVDVRTGENKIAVKFAAR